MTRASKRRHLLVESLEDKTLLSTGFGGFSAERAAALARLEAFRAARSAHFAAPTARATTPATSLLAPSATIRTSQTTGTTTTPLPIADVTALQQDASGILAKEALNSLASIYSSANVQGLANSMILYQHPELQEYQLALSKGVILPPGITGADQATVMNVIRAIPTSGSTSSGSTTTLSSFDQAYLTAMTQLLQQGISRNQTLASTTADPEVKAFAQSEVTTAQGNLVNVQRVQAGNSILPQSPSPGTGTGISAADQAFLQNTFSGSALQILLSQVATLTSSAPQVQQYANKLIQDHNLSQIQIESLVQTYNLPPTIFGLSPADMNSARQVLATANTPSYDQTYLNSSVQLHSMDIQTDQQALNSTNDPNIKALAQGDLATDYLHLIGAQEILTGGTSPFPPLPDLSGLTNVHQRYSHPGNGNLTYNLQFDAGGFRFTQRYHLNIHQLRNGRLNPNYGYFRGVDAVNLFAQLLYQRLASEGFFGQGTGTGTGTGTNTGGTTGNTGTTGITGQTGIGTGTTGTITGTTGATTGMAGTLAAARRAYIRVR